MLFIYTIHERKGKTGHDCLSYEEKFKGHVMFIRRLLLINFENISHNNIKRLELDFTSPFQLFIGTNGCGKSSVMRQLTVYPSSKDEFNSEEGYKEIEVEFNDSIYICIDDHRIGKHSIIKDGLVINDKSTASVQKGLIEQIFGLDKTLVDILTDRISFTTMSTAQRREIIMRASKIDIDMGLELLDFIGEKTNYLKQYSKNLAKRLIDEEKSLPSESHIEELNTQRQNILDDFVILDEMSTQLVEQGDQIDILNRLEQLKLRAKQTVYKFVDTPEVLYGVGDELGALELKTRFKYQIETIEHKQDELLLSIETVENQLGVNHVDGVGIEEYLIEKQNLEKEIKELEEEGGDFLYLGEGYKQVVATSQTLYESLRNIFSELQDNSNGYFSKQKKIQNSERLIIIGNDIATCRNSIHQLEHEVKRHIHGEYVSCPKCKTDFIPGLTGTRFDAEEKLKVTQEKLSKLEKLLEEEKNYQTEINRFQNLLLEIEQLNRHYPQHGILFKKLKDYGYNNNNPAYCLNILTDWFKVMAIVARYNELNIRLNAVDECIRVHKLEDAQKRREQEETLEQYNDLYNRLIDEKRLIDDKVKQIDHYLKYVANLKDWINETESLSSEIEDVKEQMLNNLQHKFVMESKAQLNNELVAIDSEISKVTYSILNRDKLVKEKEEVDNSKDLMSIIMAELSPKTGFLGDVMNEFIDEFVGRMNSIIASVWTYSMEILSCRNKKGDLDFYFPVRVQGADKLSPDVKDTSGAQTKIINFAFKYLMMKTHRLINFPLFLDEFTNGMDESHIVRMIKLVYDMVETERCSQLFMILHQANQYGSFPQAECLVINADNIQTLPEHYNTHAKIS